MTTKRATQIFALASLLAVFVNSGCPRVAPVSGEYYLDMDPVLRRIRLFVPSSYDGAEPVPLVIALHGLMDDGKGMARMTGFEALAEERGFVVVFPDGVLRSWLALPEGYDLGIPEDLQPLLDAIDDIAFVSALIDELSRVMNIDEQRVYVTGGSQGGMMAYLLALELSDRVAAVAAVMATMPEEYLFKGTPGCSVPMLIIHGTDDPIIPYEGGRVFGLEIPFEWNLEMEEFVDFNFLSAEDTAAYWAAQNQTNPIPIMETLADLDPQDGATAIRSTYTAGLGDSEVVLYTIEGGGHTWPGGPQYLPKLIIGNTCRDFDATVTIWEFFEQFRRE